MLLWLGAFLCFLAYSIQVLCTIIKSIKILLPRYANCSNIILNNDILENINIDERIVTSTKSVTYHTQRA